MIEFQLIDKKYMIGNTELPVKELLSYGHSIDNTVGRIDVPYEVGDEVWRWPSCLDRAALRGGTKRVIKEFTVFGGCLCVRFEGSNVPHSIECISPI